MDIIDRYAAVRHRTEQICAPLNTEDYVVQPIVDVSPPKWHLGHTTWFFEEFFLSKTDGYQRYNPDFAFVFNSYYESVGARVIRTNRGNLSRPTVEEIYDYRKYVDTCMKSYFDQFELSSDQMGVLEVGLNHEQQHQELLITDIKYILGHNPLFPQYGEANEYSIDTVNSGLIEIPGGEYEIGFSGDGFSFDNEHGLHKVLINDFSVSNQLVTNAEFLEFIEDNGYNQHLLWHSEGIDWVRSNAISSPEYWHLIDGEWYYYTMQGLKPIEPNAPLAHISYFEAAAFASWSNKRLPTEFEWEVASNRFEWGKRWEWTNSAYLPYPGYKKPPGAIGEYNGKFMINQMVLRGASVATSESHSRHTYRNFFHPQLRWQYTGIRLATCV